MKEHPWLTVRTVLYSHTSTRTFSLKIFIHPDTQDQIHVTPCSPLLRMLRPVSIMALTNPSRSKPSLQLEIPLLEQWSPEINEKLLYLGGDQKCTLDFGGCLLLLAYTLSYKLVGHLTTEAVERARRAALCTPSTRTCNIKKKGLGLNGPRLLLQNQGRRMAKPLQWHRHASV